VILAIIDQIPTNICRAAFWERVEGWEVVLTVLFIVAAWAVVQVSKYYLMAALARIGNEPEILGNDK
jgi:hypothetical protein